MLSNAADSIDAQLYDLRCNTFSNVESNLLSCRGTQERKGRFQSAYIAGQNLLGIKLVGQSEPVIWKVSPLVLLELFNYSTQIEKA